MSIRILTVSKNWLKEKMLIVLMKINSYLIKVLKNEDFVLRDQKYKELALYTDIVDYLERRLLNLEGLVYNKQKKIMQNAKKYRLLLSNKISSL